MPTSAIRINRYAPVVLLGAALVGVGPLRAQTPEASLSIPRVDRAPELEDFLAARPVGGTTGASSQQGTITAAARVTEFRQREPGDGVPVSQATTAYLSYDDENLYVVFVCSDDPAKVRANIARREEIGEDDQVMLYLDTFHDRQRAYFFAANARGVQRDGILTEGQDEDQSFDAVWSSEGRLTADGYVVRLAIPFRSLRFANAPTQTWGIALGRVIRRTNEEAYWPHLTKNVKGFVPQFATLNGLAQISPGRNIQVNPYSMLARARVLNEDIPGHVNERDERIGLDAKIVVRDALTIDATVNPDFSQVESDDPQVTVNERFEVFFPEKRPFFLENAGFLQTPVNLLFSRRIVDPGAGLRVTGKMGRWAVGALAMNDRQLDQLPADEPLAGQDLWVGALRVQREVGEESTVGLLATDQELGGGGQFARMYSADARLRVGDNWAVVGQVMRSETRETDASRASDWGVLADLSFDSRHVEYGGRYQAFGPDFPGEDFKLAGAVDPLGFVRRVGFRETEHELQYKFLPDDSPVVGYGPTVSALFNWEDSTGRLQDREIEASFQIELEGETEIDVSRVEAFELFEGVEFRPYATEVDFNTEWLKWLAFEASYAWGAAVNHDPAEGRLPSLERATEAEVGFLLRPTPRLRVEQAFNYSRLRTRAGGAEIFTERQFRTKVNYQFNRALSLRAIVDYEALDADTTLVDEEREREFGVDVLLTYLLHPGTALYLGYTDRYENLEMVTTPEPGVIRGRRPDLSVGRQVFVKLSYLWRF